MTASMNVRKNGKNTDIRWNDDNADDTVDLRERCLEMKVTDSVGNLIQDLDVLIRINIGENKLSPSELYRNSMSAK